MITLKSRDEILKMRKAGAVAARVLIELGAMIRPGVSTLELDKAAERIITCSGAKPSFKGYNGFPKSICASINSEVVHGIPSRRIRLAEGDIVSIDVGVCLEGWHADIADTFAVGRISGEDAKLVLAAKKSFQEGLKYAREGMRMGDISAAIEAAAAREGCTVVRELVGHGIGRTLHEEPNVPNFGNAGRGIRLKEGMTLAIEPMLSAGKCEVKVQGDGWTVVVADGSKSSHYEHTVAITDGEPEILTLP